MMKSTAPGWLLFCLLLAAGLPAQTDPSPAPLPAKLTEWPPLKPSDVERVNGQIGQLRKPDANVQAAAKQILLGIGPAAAPMLFGQVNNQPNNINEQIFAVLDDLLDSSHSALMVRESKKPKPDLRRYLTLRLCRLGEPELLPVLEAAQRDPDQQTAFYGALGALALKKRSALAPVLEYTKTRWLTAAPLVAEVLPRARCNEVGAWLFEAIAKAAPADQMAGLRLARHLAVKEQAVLLRNYLQGSDRAVVKEAVNTARVLHGEPPIENLSVFQSIEMAKEWLGKL